MLHRRILRTIAGIDDSPFGPTAKSVAQTMVDDADLKEVVATCASSPRDVFLLLWRCVAAAQARVTEESPGEFVVTLPAGVPKGARPTNLVVGEMLESATSRILVLGYAFTRHGGIVQPLIAAAARGVEILIVCDRGEGGRETFDAAWPPFVAKPSVYTNARTADAMHKMHSKLIVVDDSDLLVTSANFTYHGMLGNIEFGVRLRDMTSSKAARTFVEHLIATRSVLSAAD